MRYWELLETSAAKLKSYRGRAHSDYVDKMDKDRKKSIQRAQFVQKADLKLLQLQEEDSASIISFDQLWHVGSMNAADKGKGSYEGAGLSVSRHPNAWMHIARIGGDVWELTKNGNRFLDFHNIPPNLIAAIRQWGIDRGYVEVGTRFTLPTYDEDGEPDGHVTFDTRNEAIEEAKYAEIDPSEIHEVSDALKATSKLTARTLGADHGMEALVPVYVEDMTDLDGVWWQDQFDPTRFSAPRGVIVPSRVSGWSAVHTIEPETDDEF